jgi:hypothetical protein
LAGTISGKELHVAIIIEPSTRVLDETPARAVKFLGAISTNPNIHAILGTRGYLKATHDRGWDLMLTASGYRRPRAAVLDSPAATAAIAELDAWDEPNFRIARAALADEFPDQAEHVFEGLEPSTGAGAIISDKTFLDRLDELESSKDRKSTRKVDHAALAKLAERGITPEERARMRKLLDVALGAPEPVATDAGAPATNAAEQTAAKRALWGWLNEWSEVARTIIQRRDYLIQLGLAKRKTRKGPKGGGGGGGGGGEVGE